MNIEDKVNITRITRTRLLHIATKMNLYWTMKLRGTKVGKSESKLCDIIININQRHFYKDIRVIY